MNEERVSAMITADAENTAHLARFTSTNSFSYPNAAIPSRFWIKKVKSRQVKELARSRITQATWLWHVRSYVASLSCMF